MTHRARYWLLSACLGVILSGGAARAADPVYEVYENEGQCAQPWVLKSISNRFRYQVKHVPYLKDVSITEFHRVHEHRYIPAGEERPIARRYCGATVILSDGDNREIWYLIETGQGFATLNRNGLLPASLVEPDNVEFCVAGFDRWLVYNGACRVLR